MELIRRIYLLRHAKSSWDDPGLADRERPLAPRGRKAAATLSAHLLEQGIRPELVLCSPAQRTQETVARMEAALKGSPLEIDDALYGASAETLLERLRLLPEQCGSAMLVGHNPGLHELALALAPDGDRARLARYPTGALATLEHPGTWESLGPGSCRLAAFVVPRELR